MDTAYQHGDNGSRGDNGSSAAGVPAGDMPSEQTLAEETPASAPAHAAADAAGGADDTGEEHGATALGDLDVPDDPLVLDVAPEAQIAESLNSALKHLRDSADKLQHLALDDSKVEAAEHIAERAAELDEEIGSISRKHDD